MPQQFEMVFLDTAFQMSFMRSIISVLFHSTEIIDLVNFAYANFG